MNDKNEFKVDRTAFSAAALSEPDNDPAYWMSKTPEERFRGIEVTRQILQGIPISSDFKRSIYTIL